MATLVLNAVGTALGGPIGGALGSLVGQSIDRQMFGPGMRKGPRLGDLSVQTSNYGSPIPRIYGTMRVAGSVIWSTDIREEEAIQGGGKGSPEYLAYKYSASFAVALASRPIRLIKRIWADGKLIRGAAGDFKVKTKFRVLTGSEDQGADPLIASVETIAQTPAYRGIALALFEDLELGEFGNRIPLLTFEVEADDGPVSLATLLSDASEGLIDAAAERPISGFAAHGRSIGDSVADLIDVCGLALTERGGALCTPPSATPQMIGKGELGSGTEMAVSIERIRASEAATPGSLTLTYYDPDRDYQTGQMRASAGHGGTRDDRIELPAVLPGAEAKGLAEEALARRWSAGDCIRVWLPPARMELRPGDAIQLAGNSKLWIARSVSIEGLAVAVAAEAITGLIVPLPADPGRPVTPRDEMIGRTELALFELPAMSDSPAAFPIAYVAASNSGAWKQLPIELKLAQAPFTTVSVARRSIVGRAETVLNRRCPPVTDEISTVTVRLANSTQQLLNADNDALMAGANLAIVGDELIQFGRADLLAPGLYRLSTLLRGRRGTEWAAAAHAAGEAFCLIDRAESRALEMPAGAVGATLTATAHGIGDTAPLPTACRPITGESLRPPSPCHVRLWREGSTVRAEWVRRSHRGWAWVDGVGDADDGFSERYRLAMTGPGGTVQTETSARSASWPLAELPAYPGQPIALAVVAIGPQATSRPGTATLLI